MWELPTRDGASRLTLAALPGGRCAGGGNRAHEPRGDMGHEQHDDQGADSGAKRPGQVTPLQGFELRNAWLKASAIPDAINRPTVFESGTYASQERGVMNDLHDEIASALTETSARDVGARGPNLNAAPG